MDEVRNPKVGSIGDAVRLWVEEEDEPEGIGESYTEYQRSKTLKCAFIGGCVLLSFLVIGYALSVGTYSITFLETYQTIWNHLCGNIVDANDDLVVWEWRLPRIMTGVLAGCGLAVAGAVMQTILRNPLADPYTTGLSSGASFGATLAVGLGVSVTSLGYAIVANAFIFSLVPMAIIILVSKMKSSSPTTMVMAGIAVMYIFNAINTMVRLRLDPDTQSYLYAWSVGSISGTGWEEVGIMATITIIGVIALMLLSRRLNVMSTGDETSRSLGVDPGKMRLIALGLVSLLTAGIVSFTGLIGFVGLVCPHVARMFVGADNRYLIPASAAFGMVLVLVADLAGRLLFSSTMQVGVITAFIGGPLFLYLIVTQKKGVSS